MRTRLKFVGLYAICCLLSNWPIGLSIAVCSYEIVQDGLIILCSSSYCEACSPWHRKSNTQRSELFLQFVKLLCQNNYILWKCFLRNSHEYWVRHVLHAFNSGAGFIKISLHSNGAWPLFAYLNERIKEQRKKEWKNMRTKIQAILFEQFRVPGTRSCSYNIVRFTDTSPSYHYAHCCSGRFHYSYCRVPCTLSYPINITTANPATAPLTLAFLWLLTFRKRYYFKTA